MNTIMIITGEASGDNLGAWYLKRLKKEQPDLICHAVGGPALKTAGAQLHERMEKYNVVGIWQIIKRLPFLLRSIKELAQHIVDNQYGEVVLVDFPGFNLRLAKTLKKLNQNIKITYFCPPQLWAWGAWRLSSLKKYCDRVIVLYPFEVAWYAERGLAVEWHGSPHLDRLQPYLSATHHKEPTIALLPGSRKQEIRSMLRSMVSVVRRFKLAHPKAKIILPLASTFTEFEMKKALREAGLMKWGKDLSIVAGEQEKLKALASCCVAITKPGTITLELALLRVPAVVVFKTSWLTYLLARPFIGIKYMALPNLFLRQPVFDELIQSDFTTNKMFAAVNRLYNEYERGDAAYAKRLEKLNKLQRVLKGESAARM